MERKLLFLALSVSLFGCPGADEICNDNNDNDEDGAFDCDDADCADEVVCQLEICDDQTDNNADGDIDCDDADCAADPACLSTEDCGNGLDEDGDLLFDCDDPDCQGSPDCPAVSTACSDGNDNDNDGFFDLADLGCANGSDDNEGDNDQCNDGLDNDFDGLIDTANDPQCAGSGIEVDPLALPNLTLVGDPNFVFDDDFDFTNTEAPLIRTEEVPAKCAVNVNSDDLLCRQFRAGCFTGTGPRTILEWNSMIVNIGNADLVTGDTLNHIPPYKNNDALAQLEFEGWTRSFLFDPQNNNALVATGKKGSFCMVDFDIPGVTDQNVSSQFNDCGSSQGITAGLADIYSVGLPCQFIDITDVPTNQTYTLRVEVDFTKELPESNYGDNSIELSVFIP